MDNNHIICASGLKLLNNLLDFELNRDAEIFIRIFAEAKVKQVIHLQLGIIYFLFLFTIKNIIYILIYIFLINLSFRAAYSWKLVEAVQIICPQYFKDISE